MSESNESKELTYVFFFHKSSPFSNWYPSTFRTPDNKVFFNNEQYMMYHKALLFGDHKIADMILNEKKPAEIKKLGRKVSGFSQDTWIQHSENIVTQGLLYKFTQDTELKKILLDTESSILVEASPYDKIWGIGLSKTEALKTEPKLWPGLNKLGTCLMRARDIIRNNETL